MSPVKDCQSIHLVIWCDNHKSEHVSTLYDNIISNIPFPTVDPMDWDARLMQNYGVSDPNPSYGISDTEPIRRPHWYNRTKELKNKFVTHAKWGY